MHRTRIATTMACVALGGVLLAGCSGPAVNQGNYDKIENGMSMEEVKDILGEPTEQSAAGVSVGDMEVSGGATVWKDGDKTIMVTFQGGKVVAKAKEGF
jgi:hypothetical protein